MSANNFGACGITFPRDVPRGRYENITFLGDFNPKIWDGKNVQNSARFRTTLDFDR